jgi:hypothetical protein
MSNGVTSVPSDNGETRRSGQAGKQPSEINPEWKAKRLLRMTVFVTDNVKSEASAPQAQWVLVDNKFVTRTEKGQRNRCTGRAGVEESKSASQVGTSNNENQKRTVSQWDNVV